MASVQRIGFPSKTNQLSNIFKAFGHPARLSIIELLLREKRIMCKEIGLSLPLAQATVNRHTRVLFEQGIIGYEKHLNYTYYVLNPIVVETTMFYLKDLMKTSNVNDVNYKDVYFHLLPID